MLRLYNKLKDFVNISNATDIARRYFVINSFDGVMTVLGIIFGFYFMQALDARIILGAGIGAGIAICISGISGAYLSEKGERLKELKELEKAMLVKLKNTKVGKAFRSAPLFVALVDGISPLIAIVIILIPFMFSVAGTLTVLNAFYTSVVICVILLFSLGMLIGKFSKENMFMFGIKTLLAGGVTALILYLLKLL